MPTFIVIFLFITLAILNYLAYLNLIETSTIDTLHKYKKHGALSFIITVPFGACLFTLWMLWRHRTKTP